MISDFVGTPHQLLRQISASECAEAVARLHPSNGGSRRPAPTPAAARFSSAPRPTVRLHAEPAPVKAALRVFGWRFGRAGRRPGRECGRAGDGPVRAAFPPKALLVVVRGLRDSRGAPTHPLSVLASPGMSAREPSPSQFLQSSHTPRAPGRKRAALSNSTAAPRVRTRASLGQCVAESPSRSTVATTLRVGPTPISSSQSSFGSPSSSPQEADRTGL